MPQFTSSSAGVLQSQTSVLLPDGRTLVIEVVGDEQNYIIGQFVIEEDGTKVRDKFEGTCGGQSVGSVVCPNNDPVLNCATGSISCAS